MKFKFPFLMLLCLSLFVVSCNKETEEKTDTVVDLAKENSQFSTLVSALEITNLAGTLTGTGPFTIFAPTNKAFADFLAANNYEFLEDVPTLALAEVLLNHVVRGNVKSTDLKQGYVNTMSTDAPTAETNLSLFVDLSTGVVLNGNATVTATDLTAANGVIHEVNAVIASPTVVTHALSNPIFSTLVAALTATGLTTDFVEVLSGEGPFTVFAPTNDAFTTLLAENDAWTELSDIPTETLEAVLKYHVVSGSNVVAAGLEESMMVTTLGGTFRISLEGGPSIRTSSQGTSDIIATDVQGTNGVVHAIDAVLQP